MSADPTVALGLALTFLGLVVLAGPEARDRMKDSLSRCAGSTLWWMPQRRALWSTHDLAAQPFRGAEPLPVLTDEEAARVFEGPADGIVPTEGSGTPVPALRLVRR